MNLQVTPQWLGSAVGLGRQFGQELVDEVRQHVEVMSVLSGPSDTNDAKAAMILLGLVMCRMLRDVSGEITIDPELGAKVIDRTNLLLEELQ